MINSMIVEVSTSMSVTRRRMDHVMTWAMWLGWLALLLPSFSLFEEADAGSTAIVASLANEVTPLDYAPLFVGGIMFVASIIGLWSLYNHRFNRRIARGGHLGWLGSRRVADFYAVDLRQLFSWQHSRRLIVTHDDGGSVYHVEAECKPLTTTIIAKRDQAPLEAANEELAPIVTAVDNVIPLPLPTPSQPILSRSRDRQPTRLTYNGRVYYT